MKLNKTHFKSSLQGGLITITVAFVLLTLGASWANAQANTPPPNVLQITVNGSLCSPNSYINKPCVEVTICSPDTTNCQTIDDILLDTGSYGLRIFQQALNVSLQQGTIGSAALAECVQFGDGSSDWGPVKMANIVLGNEPAIQVPIQVIDATFATLPQPCQNADTSPAEAGFNGILGVGPFAQDCGSACAPPNSNNGLYYACAGGSCTVTAVPLSNQVSNPVASLPTDKNGIIVKIPTFPADGAVSVDGQLLLGIGTQFNNIPPTGVNTFTLDVNDEFSTNFNGKTLNSFIDTGSNGLFFPASSNLPDCGSIYGTAYSGWFCPSVLTNFLATISGASGSSIGMVSFGIGNFYSLINYYSSNNVFPDIGGDDPSEFDWGLPFYLGRNVYVGIESQSSTLGTGPYWAYCGINRLLVDFDGDGKTDIAVYRSSNGWWIIVPSSNPSAPYLVGWGAPGDIPVPGDYDGDGKTDIAVYRPSNGWWIIVPSSNPSAPYGVSWGASTDKPVPGDYDGDGKTDIAIYRPSNGWWIIVPSSNPSAPYLVGWGAAGDIPVPGDYDGDGKTDIAIYRPSNGWWIIVPSSNPSAPYLVGWGGDPSDIPITNNRASY